MPDDPPGDLHDPNEPLDRTMTRLTARLHEELPTDDVTVQRVRDGVIRVAIVATNKDEAARVFRLEAPRFQHRGEPQIWPDIETPEEAAESERTKA